MNLRMHKTNRTAMLKWWRKAPPPPWIRRWSFTHNRKVVAPSYLWSWFCACMRNYSRAPFRHECLRRRHAADAPQTYGIWTHAHREFSLCVTSLCILIPALVFRLALSVWPLCLVHRSPSIYSTYKNLDRQAIL